MTEEEKIDRFFKNRLQDLNSEDNWNVPSEEVWEKASPFFPQQKKRRRFLFFFFGAGVMLLGAIGIYQWQPSFLFPNSTDTIVIIDQQVSMEETLGKEARSKVDNEIQVNLPIDKSASSDKAQSIMDGRSKADDKASVALSDLGVQDVRPSTVETYSNPSDQKTLSKSVTGGPDPYIPVTSNEDISRSSASMGNDLLIARNPSRPTVALDKEASRSESAVLLIDYENNDEEFDDILSAKIGAQSMISLPGLALRELEIGKYDILNPKLVSVKEGVVSEYYNKRWHVGFSTERFFKNPFTSSEFEGQNDIHTSYRTGFLSVSKFLGPKLSIQSGFQYLHSNVDIGLQFEDTYDAVTPSEAVSRSIVDNSSIGILSLDGNESPISIIWNDDAVIEDGELLQFNVGLPFNLQFYSVPIYFNHYFKRDRIGYSILWGASLDVFKLDIDRIDVDLFNSSGTQLNTGASLPPLSITESGFSIYAGMGLEYNLSNDWFVSTQLRLDLLGLEYSRIGLGIYKRF